MQSDRRARNAELSATAYAKGWWTTQTLADSLREAALQSPERVVLIDNATRIDCRTLYRDAVSLASALQNLAPAGSVVSFILPNWHEAACIYLAATLAGMIAHPILPSMRDHELRFMLEDANSRVIFIPGVLRNHDYRAMLTRVIAQLREPPRVVVVRDEPGPFDAYDSLRGGDPSRPFATLDPDAIRMVLYTSGTTGTPKAVLHTHNSIHAVVRQIGLHWKVAPGDCFLVPSPISHIGGSLYAFECPLLLGARAVLMERWEPEQAVRLIEAEHCTHMAGATPFLAQLLAAAKRAHTRLPSLKVFICGGASVPPSLIREAADYFSNTAVTRVYGSSEVPVITIGAPDRNDLLHAANTDGRIGMAEVKLVDSAGAPALEGEVRVRGPQMLAGYLHPEHETDVFDAEGFFRTGDLARRTDGDYLTISGRLKDIIIRNGENISPKEIEDVLSSHPDIAEVTIVGLPDPRTGERACAVIVPKTASLPDVESLYRYLTGLGIATFKIPERVEIWESLPKNDAGKILKHRVRELLLR